MDNSPVTLYSANGQPLQKAHGSNEGRGLRILGAGGGANQTGRLKGAEPKVWDYQIYLDMYYNHPTVYSAINKIVKTATNTGYDFVPRDSRSVADDEEVARAKAFFNQQHDVIGEFRRVYRDLLIFGDAYMYVVPNRRRKPVKLKRLPPWTMHIKAKKNGSIEFYVQADPGGKEEPVFFKPNEILHFKVDDPGNDLYGVPPLQSLRSAVTADLHMAHYQSQFFANGAAVGTFILLDEAPDAELKAAQQWIKDEFVGTNNAFKPLILAGKGIDIKKGVGTHEEMSFFQGREFIINTILSVLDVPPAKVGRMETANRSNSKEQDKTFRTESIAPLQYLVESVINDQFMRGVLGCNEVIFEHSKSDVRDAQEQMDLWSDAAQHGFLSINEVRNKMGYADIDGGEIATVMTPLGAIPVDRLDLYFLTAQMNNEKIPEHPRSPASGEPIPNDSDTAISTGIKPANKALMYVSNARLELKKGNVESAWAWSVDAHETSPSGYTEELARALERAAKTTDTVLRDAYIERARALIQA